MWQPTASMDAIRARAALLSGVRAFFAQRGVLEVETPLLCRSTAVDPYLESFSVSSLGSQTSHASQAASYLQTSPEFPMKRLLAAGSGPIYQISKAFRCDEQSARHNPEFTLLEWYQPGYSLLDLQHELVDLLRAIAEALGVDGWGTTVNSDTYGVLFESVIGLDPHTCSIEELAGIGKQKINLVGDDLTRDAWLDLLMSHLVEPEMPSGLFVLTDFPSGQAALAEIEADSKGRSVAKRLELYIDGVELANGYQELIDPEEQRRRFEADNQQRALLGFPSLPIPEHLLSALVTGLPPTSGIAVGVDRLLMKLMNKSQIADVLCFPWDRA